MQTGKINNVMLYSENGTHWLAGQIVEILEIDNGEPWEPCIIRVKGENIHNRLESTWIDRKDIEFYNV